MSFPPAELKLLAERVAALLVQRKETLAVVETACGGLISASLLSIPGSSKFYRGGLTLYTLESRIAFGGWTQDDISAYRGPMKEIVSGLAAHVRKTLAASFCIAESGTAGPTGGNTPNRTPGYCAIALAGDNSNKAIEIQTGSADRVANQISFAREALQLLKAELENESISAKQSQEKI